MTPGSPPFRLGYQASLNGLRGVLMCLVLLNHDALLPDGFGFIAVTAFFVLSGFLITCLLLEEWEKNHHLSIRNFYFRRALRLLPALVTMLFFFVAFAFLTETHHRAVRELYEALRALFYFSNWAGIYHLGRQLELQPTWSLSVEEQFYLVWPWLLLLLLRRTNRPSMLCWIALGIFAVMVLRIGMSLCGTMTISGNTFDVGHQRLAGGTDTRADAFLCGCLAGVVVVSKLWTPGSRFFKLLRPASAVSAVGLLGLCFCWKESDWMIWCGWTLEALLAMIIILQLVLAPGGFWQQRLETPWLVSAGKWSYGMYLWHWPVLIALQRLHLPWRYLSFLVIALPAVLLSYYFIETPCLRIKARYQIA